MSDEIALSAARRRAVKVGFSAPRGTTSAAKYTRPIRESVLHSLDKCEKQVSGTQYEAIVLVNKYNKQVCIILSSIGLLIHSTCIKV